MKHKLFIIAVFAIALMQPLKCFAYAFTAYSPSGQLLYFNVVDSNAVVTYPGSTAYPYGDLHTRPVGDLIIPSSVMHANHIYPVVAIGDYAFSGCNGLSSVSIPNTITSIGAHAFAPCNGLTSITIPGSVETIGEHAFAACQNLTSIEISYGVTFIGAHAFNTCVNLRSITVPNSVISLGSYAFANCDSLISVSLPNSITQIHNNTFYFCTGLISLDIPASVTRIGASAFAGCSQLSSIIVPNSVTYIGNNAFLACSGLSSVVIGNSVDTIGNSVFESCTSLTSVVLPHSVTSIGSSAFRLCSSLSSIIFGDSVASIGGSAFYGTGLRTVTLPASLTTIGGYAFWECTNQLDIFCMSPIPPTLSNNTWNSIHRIYVPCNSISDYLAASYWHNSSSIILGTPFLNYTTDFAMNNENMGHVLVGITDCDSNITLTSVVDSGYRFIGWSDGVIDNPRTVHLTGDTTITALFDYYTYSMVGQSSDIIKGVVTGSDTVYSDTEVTLIATPNYGYHFTHWNDGDTTNPRSVVVTQDSILTAYFEINTYQLTVISNDETLGTVSGGGAYTHGTMVTITATPFQGNRFDHWSNNAVLSNFTFPLTSDSLITAVFVQVDTIHDTTYIVMHDTTYIDVFVHDTTIVVDTLTLTEYVPVHDTTYIDVHDTTYIDVPYPVHDTTYIDVPYPVHDTTIVVDTLTVTDTLWLTQYDTLWMHDTIIIHDTVYITEEGIGGVDALNAKVYSSEGRIVVEGADGNKVTLYDVTGRVLATKQDDYSPLRFEAPASGTYLIKIGAYPARRVVVIR